MAATLPWIEYFVVLASLVGTTGVGLYCSKSNKASLEDYMFGGRRMSVLPITLSITATLLSSSVLIAGGQEMYLYGSQCLSMLFSMVIGSMFGASFYLPVLYSLDSVSPYEFFDRRYNPQVRKVVSAVSVFDTVQLIVMSLYVPSLTFSQVSGISPFKIACALSVICLIYTVSGGLKAVAWADSFQMIILVTCTVFFFTVGLIKTGGISEVRRLNDEGYRMEFLNFDPSPFQRHTFWTSFGVFFMWTPYYFSAAQHQRYQSLPTKSQARNVPENMENDTKHSFFGRWHHLAPLMPLAPNVIMFLAYLYVLYPPNFKPKDPKVILLSMGLIIVLTAVQYSIGLLAYAYFAGCDPVLAKMDIRSHATIVPYFVSHIAANHPGMTGLFHADVIAAGLSTTTSLWNTLACTIYEDLVRPFMKPVSEKEAYRIIIWLVVIVAVITTLFTKGVESIGGTVVETLIILRTTSQSAMFVFFTAGMVIPWINSKGILAGGSAAAVTSIIVVFGSVSARRSGLVKDLPKFLTTENCSANVTSMLTNATLTLGMEGYGSHTIADDSVFWLFKLSVFFYQAPGVFVGTVISVVVSYLTGPQSLETVDPQMIVPQVRWLLPSNGRSGVRDARNDSEIVRGDEDVTETSQEMYALVPREAPEEEAEPNVSRAVK